MIDGLLTGTHLLALAGITLGAAVQAATGMGFSLAAAPVLILHLGPRDGVAVTLVLAMLASVIPLLRDVRHARPSAVAHLLVPTLLCTPLVALALRGADTRWLALAAGTGIVVAVGILARGARWPWLNRPAGAAATGAASALLNVVGGVGGPPIGIYAANSGWSPETSRANLLLFFLIQNLVTALVLSIVLPGLPELAALVLGTACGMLLSTRIPSRVLRAAVLGVSFAGGLGLLGGAF
ncbi:TSUP family transporter [Actinocorallia libanotica]|uniref:Probable membrane transporter protein n=1 Tax=Actinocorallia libanotica TaxID=46162 RepID=A0ABP4BI06_9ACTN